MNTSENIRCIAGWPLLLVGWLTSLGLSALFIFLRAHHMLIMDRMMPALIITVWIISGVLILVGTFRIAHIIKHPAMRISITMVASILQVCAYWFLLSVGAVFINYWAGGKP